MFEPINRKAAEDRRSVPLDPASLPTILQGQVLMTDANGYAVLGDGDTADPMWAFTATARLDSQVSESVSVIEAPFIARLNTDGYVGNPAKNDTLAIGAGGGNVGKLVVQAVAAVADLKKVVAHCVQAPDSDGVMLFKAIR